MTEERDEPVSDETTAVPTPPSAAAPPTASPPASTPPTYMPPASQPSVAWAPPPAAAVTAGKRTTLALAAGIVLVILGAFGVLIAVALLTVGREFIQQFDFSTLSGLDQVKDPNATVESLVTFFSIVLLICAAFYVVGGVGVMRSASWGRVLGVVIGILIGLFWLLALMAGRGRGDVSFELVLVALHAYIAIALLFFWRNRSTA